MTTWGHARGGARCALALAGASLLAAGCDLPARPAHPALWTLADFEALYAPADQPSLARDAGLPGGLPLSHFLKHDNGRFALALGNVFTEGYRSAYVTTELWSGVDQVWVQPMYVPAVGWIDGAPQVPVGDDNQWHPIFSVGPRSAFYSPYWQIIYFDVPAGTSAETYKSARQVIDAGFTLHRGPGIVMSLAPGQPGDIDQPVEMSAKVARGIGTVRSGSGWLDGQAITFLDFGTGTFRWDAQRLVEEAPLFNFTVTDGSGKAQALDVPTVGGNGPPGRPRPPDVTAVGGQPRYGSFWRVYTVALPPTARVFAPPQYDLAATLAAKNVPAASYGPDILAATNLALLDVWVGRVALNPTCFDTPDHLDPSNGVGGCVWLDSQGAIERELDGGAIRRTGLLLTCPFVSYHDVAVVP